MIKLDQGNLKGIGKAVNSTCYIVIVQDIVVPIRIPKQDEAKTKTKASFTYKYLISDLVIPIALKTAISCLFYKMFPAIVLDKLKKHKNITIIVKILNT